MSRSLLIAAVVCLTATGLANAVPLLSESFDSMGSTGPTTLAPPAGWTVGHLNPVKNRDAAGGTGAAIVTHTLKVDDGSNNGDSTGYTYNYGTTGAADRAIGNIPRTTNGDHIIQVEVINNSGSDLSSITLSYWGEQWRRNQSAATLKPEKLRLYYSATSPTTDFVSMGSSFDFNAPQDLPGGAQIALNGNDSANRTYITGTYTPAASIPSGATFYIRWYDWNDDATLDHGLAIDDVVVTPEPGSLALIVLGGLAIRRRRR
jgi:hypothetical protein